MIRNTNFKKIFSAILLSAILCLNLPLCYTANAANDRPKIIVSFGDSFSSGEGIEDFYGQDLPLEEKVKNQDWLAHRSKDSWSGQLTLDGVSGRMSQNRNTNWYFYASSGATTYHMMQGFDPEGNSAKDLDTQIENGKTNGTQAKPYYKVSLPFDLFGTEYLSPQLSNLEQLKNEGKTIDYVTLTLGGNDAAFSDIIVKAVTGINYFDKSGLAKKLNNSFADFYKKDGIRDRLRTVYAEIARIAPEAKIIVAGYPKLLDQTGKGSFFSKEEADLINNSVVAFNKEIENLVTSCKASGMKICFVSVDNSEYPTFNGHEAYSKKGAYISPVIPYIMQTQELNDFALASAYSMHPNKDGAEVYRACVQKKIDDLEKDGGQSEWHTRTTSDERDIVLVLDTSGSMSGKPIDETKNASSKFINTILKEDASIGIVTYDTSASILSDFSMNETSLQAISNNINSGGSTNIEDGLAKAEKLLSNSNAKKKIIVLMSDGESNVGKVGEELISYADSIKDDGTYIYTLGFFDGLGSGKASAQYLMEQIASDGCHYEVTDADDLVFFFGDIADQINGQKYIYVRIACPVDVKVKHNGETLSSDPSDTKTRTSFGSLTFEENQNKAEESTDDRIKILRLKDGTDYDIEIESNGKGKMDYTIGFMDDNGQYSDLREFNNIKISKKTQIATVAKNSSSTTLKVDSDGDGKYDLKYKAKANSIGKIVDYTYIYYLIGAVLILIALLILYIKIKKWKRKADARTKQKQAMKKKFCVHCGATMSGDKNFCVKCGHKVD